MILVEDGLWGVFWAYGAWYSAGVLGRRRTRLEVSIGACVTAVDRRDCTKCEDGIYVWNRKRCGGLKNVMYGKLVWKDWVARCSLQVGAESAAISWLFVD